MTKHNFPVGPASSHLAVLSDRVLLISGRNEKAELIRVGLPDGTFQHRVPAPEVAHLTASANGSVVVTISEDGVAQVRDADLEPVGEPWRPVASGYQFSSLAIDPAGRLLAIAQGDEVHVYDLSTRLLALPELVAINRTIVDVTWSQDSEVLAGTSMPPQDGPNR